MSALFLLAAAQAISSYLSVSVLHAAIKSPMLRFVTTAAVSDLVKLSVYSSVAIIAVKGSWSGVIAAVVGGVVGNALAHHHNRSKP